MREKDPQDREKMRDGTNKNTWLWYWWKGQNRQGWGDEKGRRRNERCPHLWSRWVLSPWNCASGKPRDKVTPNQWTTETCVHNDQVMQRVTDGYKLVIGHHSQGETIQTPQKHKKGHLCQASCIGDDPAVSLNVQNHFQDCGGGETDVIQG